MKILAPPAIANLDELLDLILNPAKYAGYLKQLQDMRTAITEKLDGYETKAQADEFLAYAKETREAAVVMLNETEEARKASEQQQDRNHAQFEQDYQHWVMAKEAEHALLKQHKAELNDREQAMWAREIALNDQAAELTEQAEALARRTAKLELEQEKMDRRKELLNAI